MAGADYNAKHTIWALRLISPKGHQLKLAIDSLHLNVFSTGKPTYWPTDINKKHFNFLSNKLKKLQKSYQNRKLQSQLERLDTTKSTDYAKLQKMF